MMRSLNRARPQGHRLNNLLLASFFLACCVLGWLHRASYAPPSLAAAPLICNAPTAIMEAHPSVGSLTTDWVAQAHRAAQLQAQAPAGTYIKLVLMIRHGEGTHNAALAQFGKKVWYETEAKRETYFDAVLTQEGRTQADALHTDLHQAEGEGLVIDRLIISPMSRALETAARAFPFHYASVLWPASAMEGLREAAGVYPCDRRHTQTELQDLFPAVDFSLIQSDRDPLWKESGREKGVDVTARVLQSLSDIGSMFAATDQVIAVVGHSGWISSVLKVLTGVEHHPRNCELVPITLSFQCTPSHGRSIHTTASEHAQ